MTEIRESKIETYFKDQIKNINGLCYKFKSTVNGVPDQLVAYNSKLYLVEIKRPKGELRVNQVLIHEKFKKQGVKVYTLDTFDKIDKFISKTLNAEIIKTNNQNNDKDITINQINMFDI